MKLNNKGFMLAEVTVVATLAAIVIMSMYASSIKTINAYKERENYYDVDTIYATGYIYDYIMDSGIDSYITTARGDLDTRNNTINLNTGQIGEIIKNYGQADIDIRFIQSEESEVTKLASKVTNRTFKNYINNYVKKNVSCGPNKTCTNKSCCDKYILITEIYIKQQSMINDR